MSGREDYLLRHIALLRQFIAQMLALRQTGQHAQALQVMMQAQERLFALPLSSFAHLGIDDQLEMLGKGETKEGARERKLGYALLLHEAGLTYLGQNRNDMATSAFALALYVGLHLAEEDEKRNEDVHQLICELLPLLDVETLHAPLRERLIRWRQANSKS